MIELQYRHAQLLTFCVLANAERHLKKPKVGIREVFE